MLEEVDVVGELSDKLIFFRMVCKTQSRNLVDGNFSHLPRPNSSSPSSDVPTHNSPSLFCCTMAVFPVLASNSDVVQH